MLSEKSGAEEVWYTSSMTTLVITLPSRCSLNQPSWAWATIPHRSTFLIYPHLNKFVLPSFLSKKSFPIFDDDKTAVPEFFDYETPQL